MNDISFAAPGASPTEFITRLQFGTAEFWPEDVTLPTRWHYLADLIDSDRGLLAELDGAVSIPVVEALVATAELCRQSATENVPQSDWALLRRAVTWLERRSSHADTALLAVGEEIILNGLDDTEPDFSIVAWLSLETFAQYAVDSDTVDYWVERANVRPPHVDHRCAHSVLQQTGPVQLSVAV